MRYTYSSTTDKKGNVTRWRNWKEEFKDEDTGKSVTIPRKEPIKYNGEKLVWYSSSQLRKMSKQQRESIKPKSL